MSDTGAVVFDTDGVLLATAVRHAAAWKTTFDDCLTQWQPPTGDGPPRPFDAVHDYRDLVDGRSRLDGVRAFLSSRHIDLPSGTPQDQPGCTTVHAVAARKERIFSEALMTHGVDVFEDVRPTLRRLRAMNVRSAAVSASRHARLLLEATGLDALLDAVVDGQDAAALALPGKPDPALFLAAAARLETAPARAAVVEDALVGVEAGRGGRFRLVVGLNRDGGPSADQALLAHGADLVLPGLAGLPAALDDGRHP
ncbi:HAD family hydrolase [Streptomyces sp. NPDC093093]|uniref:HAD family hydrolase n=1 Tax=Streptomyces sp. NPDC093093 TaxID=3366025 RepID=UPI0037F2EAD8